MTPFLEKFGSFNEETDKWHLKSEMQSLMNSLPLLGKFLGTVVVGPITEKFGHKWTMAFTCGIQVVGPISG